MNYVIIAAAEAEFKNAVRYYNDQSEGLGFEFAIEIEKTIERIIQYPEAWHQLSRNTRQCRCKRFPYGVIYYLKKDTIVIIAIMHLHQKPFSWKNRLKE